MSQQNALADRFRRMHHNGVLILANAWDAGSARVLEAAGSTAIATTSAGVAWSLGYPDGEQITAADLAGVVARICRVVSVPVSADIEAGYGSLPEEEAATVAAIIDAGAVGINLEDAAPDGSLFSSWACRCSPSPVAATAGGGRSRRSRWWPLPARQSS